MSDTLDWPQVREILKDTRGRPDALIARARQFEQAFYDSRPPRGWRCVVDSCMIPSIGEKPNGERIWICQSCKRPCSLTSEQRQAEIEAELKVAEREGEKEKTKHAKAAPERTPREALREAIMDREACAASITSLQSGLSAARQRVTDAEGLVDAATEALAMAEAQELEHQVGVAIGTINGKARAPLAAAARATLADVESALTLATTTRDTIKGRLSAAEAHLESAENKVKTTALNTLRHEGVPVSAAIVEEIETVWEKVPLLQYLVSIRAAVGVKPHSPAWTLLGNLPPNGRQDDQVTAWKATLAKLQQDANAKLATL